MLTVHSYFHIGDIKLQFILDMYNDLQETFAAFNGLIITNATEYKIGQQFNNCMFVCGEI